MNFEKLSKNLQKKGFSVSHFNTKDEAARYLDAALDGKTIGVGGSMSVSELGVYDLLRTHNRVYWHMLEKTDEVMLAACNAEVYLCGANAVAETGEVVNIDGRGNRVAGTLMKKEVVYLLAGRNKIAPDLEAAIERARGVAAPKNSRRLGMKTPCAVAGRCYDCSSPERICSALLVFWQKPFWAERMEIVVIDEEVGY